MVHRENSLPHCVRLGVSRGPSTVQTSSLCESVCYAQDDSPFKVLAGH
jgi:hypothetical protein